MPCAQRSSYLNEMANNFGNLVVDVPEGVDGQTRDVLERCMATCGRAAGMRAKRRSRVRKEASAKEVRGYYKQFAEAKHLEYRSWVDNEVFDLAYPAKVKPRNYVTGRWVLTMKTEKQGNFLKAKAMGIERFPRQTDGMSTHRVPCFHKTWISDELPNGSQQEVKPFITLISTQPFLQRHSCSVNRDVVCHLPPEAGHPP